MTISLRENSNYNGTCIRCPSRPRMLCAHVNDRLIAKLAAMSTKIGFKKGDPIFYEGDPADFSYNIVEGHLRLSRVGQDGRRQVFGFLSNGDYFGHTSKNHYSLSAEALSDGSLCRFRRKALAALLEEDPVLERQFNQMTAGMLDDMHELLFTLGRKNALERVASFLLHSFERQAMGDTLAREIHLPMTRADIADFLGLTIETVSRSFSKLKRDGVIAIEQAHYLRLLDRPHLIELSASEVDIIPQKFIQAAQ